MFKQFSRPTAAKVEREAGRISDPLDRLRYLRKHAPGSVLAAEPLFATGPSTVRRARIQILGILATCAVALAGSTYALRPQWFHPQPPAAAKLLPPPSPGPAPAAIWQVDRSQTEEVYSNGLRIDVSFAIHNRPRAEYAIFAPTGDTQPASTAIAPRGIVFHTTESDLVPFDESEDHHIKVLGHLLLEYVRREHSYHYLIDRYGRVYRVVEESDAANHAGYSVWADKDGVYVNLNDSFLGIAFEGKTGQRSDITSAQISSARMLTELLRDRYHIASEDCVTHAQVSVNPLNMRIGNHLDWAHDFPWQAFDLPDNYRLTVPAVTAFGFSHDIALTKASGGKDWSGLASADQALLAAATAQNASEGRHRGMLRHRYQEILADLKRQQDDRDAADPKTSRSAPGAIDSRSASGSSIPSGSTPTGNSSNTGDSSNQKSARLKAGDI